MNFLRNAGGGRISAGSLITHLLEDETLRVLYYPKIHLTTGGNLVFTSHTASTFMRDYGRERFYERSQN